MENEKSLKVALEKIAAPRDCGCYPICECTSQENLEIEVAYLRDIARTALNALKLVAYAPPDDSGPSLAESIKIARNAIERAPKAKTPLQAYLAPADDRPRNGAWAPGHYLCKCLTCEGSFIGDKRAISCGNCAYAANPDGYPQPKSENCGVKPND